MLHRTLETFCDGSLYRTLDDARISSKSLGIVGLASTAMLLVLLAVIIRTNRISLRQPFLKIWSLRWVAVPRSGSLKAGRLRPQPLQQSSRPWTPLKSARQQGMRRDGLSSWSMFRLVRLTQEARQVPFLRSTPLFQLRAPAGQERGQKHKGRWRLSRLRNGRMCRGKRLARQALRPCLRRLVLAASPTEPSPRPLPWDSSLPLLADQTLAAPLHLAAIHTVSQPLQRLPPKMHRATSLAPSLDLATSFLAPCSSLQTPRPARVSTRPGRMRRQLSPSSKCPSRTSVDTSAALHWAVSLTACSVGAIRADSHSKPKRAGRLSRRGTADILLSA